MENGGITGEMKGLQVSTPPLRLQADLLNTPSPLPINVRGNSSALQ